MTFASVSGDTFNDVYSPTQLGICICFLLHHWMHLNQKQVQVMRLKCANDHAMVKDNIYWYQGYALCKECRRVARKLSARKTRDKITRKLRNV